MVDMTPQGDVQEAVAVRPTSGARGVFLGEAVLGIVAIVLAIVGLGIIGMHYAASVVLLSAATIVLGSALLFEGGAIRQRYNALLHESVKPFHKFRHRSGMIGVFIGGTGAIALGVLAVLSIVPMILVPVAAISLGLAMTIVSAVHGRLNALEITRSRAESETQEVARETVMSSAGMESFLGIAAATLGVLALVHISPIFLSFVAILSIGAAQLLSGSVMTRMLNLLRQREQERLG